MSSSPTKCPYCKSDCIVGQLAFECDGGWQTNYQVQCSQSMTKCGYRGTSHWAKEVAIVTHNELCERANRPVRKYGLTARGKPSVLARLHKRAEEDEDA